MATLKIPYKGVSYPLYLTPTKETTPALKVGNLGYAFLAQDKALGDPMLYGSSILKGAPLKITKDGTSYRSMYEHGKLGDASCKIYYYASYDTIEGSQVVRVCTRYNQYGQCISWGNQTQYRYYHKLYSNIKIADFTIANDDCRLVVSSMICQEVDVNNTEGKHHETDSAWGGWTTRRYSNYPAKPTKTLDVIATGEYSLQINCNNNWVTIKSGTCTCPVNVNISSTSTQVQTVSLTLG